MTTAYLTFHVHNYGIGFTKNILGAFYSGKLNWNNIDSEFLVQKDLEYAAFKKENYPGQVLFDHVYYLHVEQKTINKITSTRSYKGTECLRRIKEDNDFKNTYNLWEKVLSEQEVDENNNELDQEINQYKKINDKKSKEALSLYWKIIHYYTVDDQIKWFYMHANSKNVYDNERFKCVNLESRYNLTDLHDHRQIAQAVQRFLKDEGVVGKFDRIVINISNVGYEVQVVWFALAQSGWFPDKVKFITTYDRKDQQIRFKDIKIKEVSRNVLEEVSEQVRIYDVEPVSDKRRIAETELRQYINKGFSILILGERGVGKTKLISDNSSQAQNKKFRSISSAAYDDDTRLEAELFGYVSGAYTDAKKGGADGLFHIVSPEGILFIDELHAMSKRVQEKLMASLSTNSAGEFEFRRLGGDKTETAKFTVIFASNKSIEELKYQYLLPDFYDRVVQYIITIPPLREARNDIEQDWENTWGHQNFNTKMKCPRNNELFAYLRSIDFPGNWRDLQRIAIWYEAFKNFDSEHKKLIGFDSPLDYVKSQYENICLRIDKKVTEFEFSEELTANGQVENYMKHLALWAKNIHGSFKKAAAHFNEKGDDIVEKTLYNWAYPEKKHKAK